MKVPSAPSRGMISALVLALLLFVPLPFFPEYGGANSATRMMLVSALVDEGKTRIDAHAALTVDKALHEGHYYSDKAPGMAFLGVPAYAAGKGILAAFGHELDLFVAMREGHDLGVVEMMVYRAMVFTSSGLLLALAGVFFLWMGARMAGSLRPAALAMGTVFLATPWLGWSVQFFGHAAVGACLILAFTLATGLQADLQRPRLRAMAAGIALGLAISIEYTAAPPVVLIALYAIWHLRRWPAVRLLEVFGFAFLGGLLAVLPMLVYHQVSFGGPFKVGYSNVVGFEGMQQGFLGLTFPDPGALWGIIFGFQRGLFWLAPVIVLVPVGVWRAWRAGWWRAEIVLCFLMVLYYFLFNASYFYWQGGASVGPRHVIPAIPFMGLPLLWLWTYSEGRLRQALVGLSVLGLIFALVTAMTTMTVHLGYRFPLKDPILEGFFTEINAFRRWDEMGVPGWPLLLVWSAGNVILVTALWRRVVAFDLRSLVGAADQSAAPQSSR